METNKGNGASHDLHTRLVGTKEGVTREGTDWCRFIDMALNAYYAEWCGTKVNHLEPVGRHTHGGCACTGGEGEEGKTDLIILIDGSGSMANTARGANDAAAAAIAQAKRECPSDLRIAWFTVDNRQRGTSAAGAGIWPGTNFTQTHEQYLRSIGVTGPFFHDASPIVVFPNEQGADAIADLAKYFNWREGACRSIFYISDTNLDADRARDPNDPRATANAITEADNNGVTVSAHLKVPSVTNNMTAMQQDYANLCAGTGGSLYVGPVNTDRYVELLRNSICNACRNSCRKVPIADLRPCVSIAWGESECDCMETDDFETLCITVCNCYSNVTFSGLSIGYIIVTDASGNPVPALPDGRPSVQVHPLGPICFGDIGPCVDGRPACVSREVVLVTKGAKSGSYQVIVGGICFDVTHHYDTEERFQLNLCRD
jgi:hypothetical protein